MPKVKIDNALKRGSPGSGKAAGEQITYEATMGSIGLIIETETDKKTRTIANVKTILKKGQVLFPRAHDGAASLT